MKKLPIILLSILIVVQFAVPFSMIRQRETILRDGDLFKFKTRPIDPADPMQGRYVRLGYDRDFIPDEDPRDHDLNYQQPIFVLLDEDEEGFASFSSWSLERPENQAYLQTRYLGDKREWNRDSKSHTYKGLRIDIPFDRYYMAEDKAPRAETLVREATRSTNCWANVRILRGKTAIEEVFAEGQSLRDLATEKE